MSTVYDCQQADSRVAGLTAARGALKSGRLVVMPTDTLYGLAADAFDSSAVTDLLRAKGRGRDMPVPVLRQAPSLAWDLGDAQGTVMLRMPLHPVALELLREVGPLAVSSANISGQSPATTVTEARDQLGGSAAVYLDGGPAEHAQASTIVDLTSEQPKILRAGAVSVDAVAEVLGMSVESLTQASAAR